DPLERAGPVPGEQERELIAAASERLPVPGGSEDLPERDQDVVADLMAVRVVDPLEVVHVHDAERELDACALGLLDALSQRRLVGAVIAEAGEAGRACGLRRDARV